jgi:hypothetical protein
MSIVPSALPALAATACAPAPYSFTHEGYPPENTVIFL